MASLSDNTDKEASRWFAITITFAILYIGSAFFFVVSQEVEPSEDQVQVHSHD